MDPINQIYHEYVITTVLKNKKLIQVIMKWNDPVQSLFLRNTELAEFVISGVIPFPFYTQAATGLT